jgi:hypothetical protein
MDITRTDSYEKFLPEFAFLEFNLKINNNLIKIFL